MAPKSVTFRRHDHLVSVLFEDLLSHSYNITFSMFLDLVFNRISICTFGFPGSVTNKFLEQIQVRCLLAKVINIISDRTYEKDP